MNYIDSPMDSPKLTRDMSIFAEIIRSSEIEAQEMKKQEAQYGEPKLVRDENV